MNRRVTTILLLAFVVAAISSFLVYRVTGNQAKMVAPKTTKVLIATRDLGIGSIVTDLDVTTGDWIGMPPKGVFGSKEAVVGRGVVSQVYQGEPILENRLAAPGSGGGLAAIIKPGMRACAVRVDDVVGVAGFVTPGMRVDVLVSGNGPGAPSNDGPKAKTLLQNIEVLSAGTNIQKDNQGKPVQVPVVNLLVTPEQAELLSLASQTRIQLVLRNPLDTDTPKTPSIAMASVFSDQNAPQKPKTAVFRKSEPVPPPPSPRFYLIQVFNGAKHSEEKFAETKNQ